MTIEDLKPWLRIDGNDDDSTLSLLLNAAVVYIHGATGKTIDLANTKPLEQLLISILVGYWFDNREGVVSGQIEISENLKHSLDGLFTQVKYC